LASRCRIFASYRHRATARPAFSRLLDRLDLPQPPTGIVKSTDELREAISFPSVVKTSVGTASRGILVRARRVRSQHRAL